MNKQHRQITSRAIRLLSQHREQLKEAYIDVYIKETGYTIDQCELVETTQQVDGRIEMTWFMRKRDDG
jgi:hypothetical protein